MTWNEGASLKPITNNNDDEWKNCDRIYNMDLFIIFSLHVSLASFQMRKRFECDVLSMWQKFSNTFTLSAREIGMALKFILKVIKSLAHIYDTFAPADIVGDQIGHLYYVFFFLAVSFSWN